MKCPKGPWLWNKAPRDPGTAGRGGAGGADHPRGLGHERIILTRHSKAVACLVPPEDLQRLESEGQAAIRLTSTGQPPEISQSAPLRIAAQHRPPGQPQA